MKKIDLEMPLACLTVQQFFEMWTDIQESKEEVKELLKYFTVRQLAEFTGYSVATINIKNSKKEIPGSRKVNGRVLFDSATIIDWIESGAIKTKKERLQVLENNFNNRRAKR